MTKTKTRNWGIALELLIIALWTIWVYSPYLNFDPSVYPVGREFKSAIASHHLWPRLLECGSCAFWNGDQRGGFPAFADIATSTLNPVVALPTVLLGVVNGAKVALLLSFGFAGFAQWWISKLLDVRPIVRVWSGMLAAAGGHIAVRMELGASQVVVATAMGSLAIAAIIWLYKTPGSKPVAILGSLLACVILAGSGYMQIGLIALTPAVIFLVFDQNFKLNSVWLRYAKAGLLALFLAAFFLIPFLNFADDFDKAMDPQFKAAQPIQFLPLNLVIDDPVYYKSEVLGKLAFPHLYALFIGWVPVTLAVIGFMILEKKERNISHFLLAGIILIFLTASAITLKLLVPYIPSLAGARHAPQIAGLAVPLIIAFSAVGLEWIFERDWPRITLGFGSRILSISPSSLILVALLLVNLQNVRQFAQLWIDNEKLTPGVRQVIAALDTPNLQWVSPPFGEHFWIEPAIAAGLKLTPGIMTYRWKDHELPIPVLEADRFNAPEDSRMINEVDGIPIYRNAAPPYAAVYFEDDGYEACTAQGRGGHITVHCETNDAGTLKVFENSYSGWQLTVDGRRWDLLNSQWLETRSPIGVHDYDFNYRPWDVPLGLVISGIGLLIFGWLVSRPDPEIIE